MGTFKCGYKDHDLNTDSIDEMRVHFDELEHRYVGNMGCFNCGKSFKIDKELKVDKSLAAPRLLCPECASA